MYLVVVSPEPSPLVSKNTLLHAKNLFCLDCEGIVEADIVKHENVQVNTADNKQWVVLLDILCKLFHCYIH